MDDDNEPLQRTSNGTCPWCGYEFQELYLQFGSDNAEFDCSKCGKPITGYRDIICHLHPVTNESK
jgi:DNA-directed RNA polymerase subunit RPC12/RpoP